jgi:opacity protein-like surface antigen
LSGRHFNIDGEAEGFGLLINGGGKIQVSSKMNIIIGAGFGAINQEIGFDVYSMINEEESTLFSYQLFTGVNFDVSNNLRVGLRYRWMRVGEMELFTARDLHLAELSLGYVF